MNKKIIPLLIGAAFAALGSFLMKKQLRIVNTGIKVEAQVIQLQQKKNNTAYFPVVEFELEDNTMQTVQLNSGSNPSIYQIGDKVDLIYSKNDSKNVVVNSTFGIYGVPYILFGLSIFIIGGR